MDIKSIPVNLRRDTQLREVLLSYFLESLTSAELAGWLKDIGQDSRGTVEERRLRIRENTKYLTMPEVGFPDQTESYLAPYSAPHLEDLCIQLGLPVNGNKDSCYRRIMREVRYREGWLQRVDPSDVSMRTSSLVAPFLEWVPLTKRSEYEREFYPIIYDELSEVFGNVYEQLPIAHGSTLKIDFHVGSPQGDGVGIEVKLPKNNSDIQRLFGQLDQYKRRYAGNMLLFVLVGFLKPEAVHLMQEELKKKDVLTVCR